MFFIVNNVLAIACAWCIGRLACPSGDPLRRGLASMVGFAAVVIIALQLLGFVGRLSNAAVTILMAAITTALLLLALKGGMFRRARRPATTEQGASGGQDAFVQAAYLIAVALFFGVVGAAVVRSCFAGTEFTFDDLTYHAAGVPHWLRDYGFAGEAINAQAYYPKVAELLSLWFVLPFGSDAYASLAGLYWLLLLAISALHVSRRLGVSWPAALLAATLCVGAFKTSEYARSFSAADLATYASLLAATAFALPAAGTGASPLSRRDALLSGAAAGLAMGAKLFALPGVALLFVWWCIADRGQASRARLVQATCYASAAAVVGSFWYARAFILTGNPFFPAEIGPFAGMPGFGQTHRLLDALLVGPGDGLPYRGIASSFANTGLAAVLVAVAGYVASVGRFLGPGLLRGPRPAHGVYLLFLLGAAYALMYPLLPFSGFRSYSGEFVVPARYVAALVVPVGVILFYWACTSVRGLGPALLAFSVLAVAVSWRGSPEDVGMAMLMGSAALLVVRQRSVLLRVRQGLGNPVMASAAMAAFLATLAFWLPQKQRLTDENLFQSSFAQPLTGTWRFIEANVPAGSRITWHGPRAFQYYPLFGRDYRLEPIRTRSDGNLSEPFFEESRQVPLVSIDLDRIPVDTRTFVHNLRSGDIDYVLLRRVGVSEKVSTPELLETWQSQLEALQSSKRARLAFDDGQTTLWQLDGDGGEGYSTEDHETLTRN